MKLIRIHCHTENDDYISEFCMEIHPDLLAIYEELGIIELKGNKVNYEDMLRLQKILRLKQRCGVNTVGATIIVDLLKKIEDLQDEIERLHRK